MVEEREEGQVQEQCHENVGSHGRVGVQADLQEWREKRVGLLVLYERRLCVLYERKG